MWFNVGTAWFALLSDYDYQYLRMLICFDNTCHILCNIYLNEGDVHRCFKHTTKGKCLEVSVSVGIFLPNSIVKLEDDLKTSRHPRDQWVVSPLDPLQCEFQPL